MMIETACAALRSKRALELRYDGYVRVVEVHAVGWTRAGDPAMRVWQASGGSVRGERQGWKLLKITEASGAAVRDEPAQVPRRGYKRGDAALNRIVCEL